jgi:peptide/nickel transport system permease protein
MLARDYTVVLGITVLLALLIMVANLIVDIVHAYLDPRVRVRVAA